MKSNPDCTLCALHKTTDNVCILGSGSRPQDVMVVGEAPGVNFTENRQIKPFSGRSGRFLREHLDLFDLEDSYICNAVSCKPPPDKTPTKAQIKHCKKWLDYQIAIVKPKFVLLLGNTPLQSITGKAGITRVRGRPFEKDGIIYFPTFHPNYVLRDTAHLATFNADLDAFSKIVEHGEIVQEDNLRLTIVDTWKKVDQMIDALRGLVSYDIETNGLYAFAENAKITAIGFGTSKGEFSVPMEHDDSPWSPDDIDEILERIDKKLDDCNLCAQNGKFDFLWTWVIYGLQWHQHMTFDTMLAHYMLDENDRHGLKYLAMKYLNAPDWEIDLDKKKGAGPFHKLAVYHAHDLYYTRQLTFLFKSQLQMDSLTNRVFENILMPCARAFVEIEYDGVYIDESKFGQAEHLLRTKFKEAENDLRQHGDINWGSTTQLREHLFGTLGIKPLDMTKSGKYPSTSESVIKRIDHPAVESLLKFRGAKQQLSFFIDGWKPYLHKQYLHPSFKLHGAVTGRPSCENPNLQQVPRDPLIRTLITAPPGWTLVEVDFSQVELRIAADMANEYTMLSIFDRGEDIHWLTAINEIARGGGQQDVVLSTGRKYLKNKKATYSECIDALYEMGPDKAQSIDIRWKELRKKAKAINFGYLYGMWWKKFKIYARDTYGVIVTDSEAQESRKGFFAEYNRLSDWHKKQKRFARTNGYIRSPIGRKRRLPAATSYEDTPSRQAAERQAVNSPVQGGASDLNLCATVEIKETFSRDIVRVCATVHDAILMRVKNEHILEVVPKCLEIMSDPRILRDMDVSFKVPLVGDESIGPWGAGVELPKWLKSHSQK